MKARIHRGTKEIGGNCIEISSNGKTIILDIGMPLTLAKNEEALLPNIDGLNSGDNPGLLGIIISHPHQDHYGLLPKVHSSIPVYIGKDAHAILEASAAFSPSGVLIENVEHYSHKVPFTIGPFNITPYLNDHSAYDAYSLLIEADGKTLFYTGDFRTHGRKSILFNELLSDGPKNVDVLLMEGTNISRQNNNTKTESNLEADISEILQNTKGLGLAWFSGQNIDRFVTFYRAAKKSGRTMIVDIYIARILDAIDNPMLPAPLTSDIRVFLPSRMRNKIIRDKSFDLVSPYYNKRIYLDELKETPKKYLMTFRPVMATDLQKANCLSNASLIYSMWEGYLERDDNDIQAWCNNYDVNFKISHTSGHSDLAGMQKLAESITPKKLIPIHTFYPELYSSHFDKVTIINDGEWCDI